ncbi:MAG: ubiquitin-like protein Pup [Bifidobacterium animalis]|nr:ubiquitin-like protein Pup [Bifidobacterium animalis]MDY5041072.1 ubiquitin-like protein Pup [Bifidobacterium animalis]
MPSASEHHQIPAETQRHDDQTQETVQDLSAAGMLAQEQADDLDAILDDIETVLETNAEEYVNSFVQKGGE